MNALNVLEYPSACYFKFPNLSPGAGGSLWDFSATTAIYNELKRPAGNINGQPLDLNRPDSTYMGHEGILFASDEQLAAEVRGLYKNLAG